MTRPTRAPSGSPRTAQRSDRFFYGTIPLYLARHPQTIPALDMNGAPLPIEHGAPVRLRVEAQLGFKMVKWINGIEFVADIARRRHGHGRVA